VKASKTNTMIGVYKEEVLRNATNPKVTLEAFVKLVTVYNLPYNYN
jgi:hypothetical protein